MPYYANYKKSKQAELLCDVQYATNVILNKIADKGQKRHLMKIVNDLSDQAGAGRNRSSLDTESAESKQTQPFSHNKLVFQFAR